MSRDFRQLPPLDSLIFFEAAARHLSFTKAAEELFLTQGAVSKQIKMLEQHLGQTLFERRTRQLLLTDAGRTFHSDVSVWLQQIQASVSQLRRQADQSSVTIICTPAVSHYWLFPHVVNFNRTHPEITINIYASNELSETSCTEFDFAILNGPGQWTRPLQSHLVFRERIYPVCHKDYPVDTPLTPRQLLEHKLIHLDPNVWRWPTWIDWFREQGIEYSIPPSAQQFNQVTLAADATLRGMGIGLGWDFMSHHLIQSGELKQVCTEEYQTGMDDYLVYHKGRTLSAAALCFKDWLLLHLDNP